MPRKSHVMEVGTIGLALLIASLAGCVFAKVTATQNFWVSAELAASPRAAAPDGAVGLACVPPGVPVAQEVPFSAPPVAQVVPPLRTW